MNARIPDGLLTALRQKKTLLALGLLLLAVLLALPTCKGGEKTQASAPAESKKKSRWCWRP